MSMTIQVKVGMTLQRTMKRCEDALYTFNAIQGARVQIEGIDDMGVEFIVLDGVNAGWQLRRGWHLITDEWFIPD